jgi:hypothetical protein
VRQDKKGSFACLKIKVANYRLDHSNHYCDVKGGGASSLCFFPSCLFGIIMVGVILWSEVWIR